MPKPYTKAKRPPMSEAAKEKLRQARLGKKASLETRAKQSVAGKGRKHSDEARAKISAGNKGLRRSDAARAKMSAAQKGQKHPWQVSRSETTRQRISATLTGKTLSTETRAKMSATRKGVPKSEETRRRMSESQKDRSLPGNIRRSEALSKRNVREHLAGTGFLVKGHHVSPKAVNSPVAYRSKEIELRLMLDLDADPKVVVWESPLPVVYRNEKGMLRHALPDFLITFVDGTRRVLEGKGPHLLTKYLSSEKFHAVLTWCKQNRTTFEVVTTSNRGRDFVRTRIL